MLPARGKADRHSVFAAVACLRIRSAAVRFHRGVKIIPGWAVEVEVFYHVLQFGCCRDCDCRSGAYLE